jgi:hypothetical protein
MESEYWHPSHFRRAQRPFGSVNANTGSTPPPSPDSALMSIRIRGSLRSTNALQHLSKIRNFAIKAANGQKHLEAVQEIIRQLAVGPED